MVGESYTDAGINTFGWATTKAIVANYPEMIFLTVIATSSSNASFTIYTSATDNPYNPTSTNSGGSGTTTGGGGTTTNNTTTNNTNTNTGGTGVSTNTGSSGSGTNSNSGSSGTGSNTN
jgi:hypothetical protein